MAIATTAGISPKSCFQIGGAGAVGTGSIRGMPVLACIRDAGIAIWPFDPPRLPMVVEIYPRVLTGPVNKSSMGRREQYLRQHHADIGERRLKVGAESEDAFDAIVSAFVMSQYHTELENIGISSDEYHLVEGTIWSPRNVGAI